LDGRRLGDDESDQHHDERQQIGRRTFPLHTDSVRRSRLLAR
jgi:hypothetical protein